MVFSLVVVHSIMARVAQRFSFRCMVEFIRLVFGSIFLSTLGYGLFLEKSNVFYGMLLFSIAALTARLVRNRFPDKIFTIRVSQNDIIYAILAIIGTVGLLLSSLY